MNQSEKSTGIAAIKKYCKKYWMVLAIALFGFHTWTNFALAYWQELTEVPYGKKLYDDAYMFLRYAKIWLAGYGESWNIGEGPVYGNTSQLHFLVVLALRAWTTLADRLVLSLSSALPTLVFLLYLPWVCAKHGRYLSEKSAMLRYGFWAATVGGAFLYFSSIPMHFKTGMDACLSLLLHLCLIDAVLTYAKTPARWRLIAISVIIYLAYLTRPDNLMTCVLFSFAGMVFLAKQFKEGFLMCCLTGALVVVDALLKWQYFGDIIPLAFYVKQQGFYEGMKDIIINSPWFSFSHFLYGVWPFALLLAWYVHRKNLLMVCVFLIPALCTIFYYFTIQTIMNLEARYFFPFTVYIIMAAVISIDQESPAGFRWKYVWIVPLFMVLYWGIGQVHERRWDIAGYFTKDPVLCDDSALNAAPQLPRLPKIPIRDSYHGITDMLKLLPPGVKVAMTEHGYVGAFNIHVNIVDVTGLHNREVAHQGYSVDWFYEQKVDAVWIPHWSYTCLNAKTFSDERFRQEYDFYPVLFLTGYAIRKQSPYYAELNDALQTIWQDLYPGLQLKDYRLF